MPEMQKTFSEADLKSFEPELKIGLLATINGEGLPHITLISTLQACSPTQLFWGQFAEGLSKVHIRHNPRVGWLILTLDKNVWRGKATFTHTGRSGKEYELLNNTPMFRYNAYFGIHTVYYMDLVEHTGKHALPMGTIIRAAIKTMVARTLAGRGGKEVLNLFTRRLLDKIDNLKFLAYVDRDGYPVIIPVIQAQTAGADRIIFASSAYREDLQAVPKNASAAVFCMSFQMQTVMLRGNFNGLTKIGGIECGSIEVDYVYSPMPPKAEQIFPYKKLEAITSF